MQKVVAVALLLLSACSHDRTPFPSLGQRPAEKRGFAEPAAPPPEPVRADPALDGRIAALTTRLAAVRAGFDGDLAKADRAAQAARGRTVGSEPWLTAQVALAALDDWRAQTSALASDVGELAANRAATLAAPYPALEAIQATLTTEVTRQSAAIDRIQAMLPAA
jgi:hypothetical protein